MIRSRNGKFCCYKVVAVCWKFFEIPISNFLMFSNDILVALCVARRGWTPNPLGGGDLLELVAVGCKGVYLLRTPAVTFLPRLGAATY